MHSSIFNSPPRHYHHHHHSPTLTRPPLPPIRAASSPATSNIDSNPNPLFLTQPNMDHVLPPETDSNSTTSTSNLEAEKIQRNSLYLTFNAPQVDEYHRGIFLTHPPIPTIPESSYSGTLFHASYISPSPSPSSSSSNHSPSSSEPPTSTSTWTLEQRPVRNISTSQSLVLLYRLGTLSPSTSDSIEQQFQLIQQILESVPLGRSNREAKLGKLRPGEGNQVLDGYDCVIWTKDAVSALAGAGIISVDVEIVMRDSREMAGPEDARTMVGVGVGGFRVFN